MVFPFVTFPTLKGGRRKLSDIEYLAIKEFGGKLKTDYGVTSGTTAQDIATLTASTGKDMYLASAKISIRCGSSNNSNASAELIVNGVTVAEYRGGFMSNATGANAGATSADNFEFAIKGVKVAASQIIKIRATTIGTAITIAGELVCFEESTGISPKIT